MYINKDFTLTLSSFPQHSLLIFIFPFAVLQTSFFHSFIHFIAPWPFGLHRFLLPVGIQSVTHLVHSYYLLFWLIIVSKFMMLYIYSFRTLSILITFEHLRQYCISTVVILPRLLLFIIQFTASYIIMLFTIILYILTFVLLVKCLSNKIELMLYPFLVYLSFPPQLWLF